MGSINGMNLREQMHEWVSKSPDAIADQYLAFVDYAWHRTTDKDYFDPRNLDAFVIRGGLVGESGELAEEIKKGIRSRGVKWHPLDLVLEIGDVLFYLSCAALRYGDAETIEQVRGVIRDWSKGQPDGYTRTIHQLAEALPFDPHSDRAWSTRSLHLDMLGRAEDVAFAATQLAISIRNGFHWHNNARAEKAIDTTLIVCAMLKLAELGAMLHVHFRDLFVLNAAKVIERDSKSGITVIDAFDRMVEALRPRYLKVPG